MPRSPATSRRSPWSTRSPGGWPLGLVNLTNVLDPAMFVLGGGLAATPELYEPPIAHWFDALLYSSEVRPAPRLAFATMGEQAAAVGAALLGAG